MTKVTINRPKTVIKIDGSPEEIKKILEIYGGANTSSKINNIKKGYKSEKSSSDNGESTEDVVLKIVQEIRNGENSERIESNILDQSSQIDKVLLPLYIAKHINNDIKLTSGDIYNVLRQLGIKMLLPNISKTLGKTGSKYVVPQNRRKKGTSGQYTLALKGEKYIASLLN